jgi:hypothetical protein
MGRVGFSEPSSARNCTSPRTTRGVRCPAEVRGNRWRRLSRRLHSEDAVRSLRPGFDMLSTIQARAIIVTSVTSSTEYDVISRVFAPRLGIDEDPVTGSAHCCLGPFWMTKLQKKELIAYQASARGGMLRLRMNGDACISVEKPPRRVAVRCRIFALLPSPRSIFDALRVHTIFHPCLSGGAAHPKRGSGPSLRLAVRLPVKGTSRS